MSKTTMRQVPLWKVVPAAAEPERYLERDLPGFAEWVRLLVGRSLAFAQLDANEKIEYLVLGIPLDADALKLDDGANRRVKDSLNADFDVLKNALQKHKAIISSHEKLPGPPQTFLRAYGVLALLKLPEELSDWHVTDEGLTIVNWGLEKGKRLFDWKPEELEAKRLQLIQQIDARLSPSKVGVASSGRNGSEESAQVERSIDKTLQDPLPSGGSKVKCSASEPKPGGSQPTRPEPEPPKGLRAWFSHPAMTVSIQVVIALMLAGTGFAVERFVLSNSAEQAAAATNAETKRDQTAARYEKLVRLAKAVSAPCPDDLSEPIEQLRGCNADIQTVCKELDKQAAELKKKISDVEQQMKKTQVEVTKADKVLQKQLDALDAAYQPWKKLTSPSDTKKSSKASSPASSPDGSSPPTPPEPSASRGADPLELQRRLSNTIDALLQTLRKSNSQDEQQSQSVTDEQGKGETSPQAEATMLCEKLLERLASLKKSANDLEKKISSTAAQNDKSKRCTVTRDKEVNALKLAAEDRSTAANSHGSKRLGEGSQPPTPPSSPNPPVVNKPDNNGAAGPEAAGASTSGGAAASTQNVTDGPNGDKNKVEPK